MPVRNRPAYIVGQRSICYRFGVPALVIGVKMVVPEGSTIESQERPSLHIRFADGKEDFIPFSEVGVDEDAIYRLLSPDEVMLKVKKASDKYLE